jgi:ABC-type multidrug transport system fused ATPase/permease subunit
MGHCQWLVFKVAVAVLNGGVFAGIAFQQLIDVNKAFAAAETIFEIIDRKPSIENDPSSGLKLNSIKGKADIVNGKFSYPTRKTTKVLRNLTLAIKQGEKIGLVGQSGCGKSTVIQLIQRFYDLDEGVVNVDDYNIQTINVPFMRSKLGIVSQEPVLFDRSIADNIKYGDNTREVAMEEVIEAAKKSNIHNFVKDLPQGYDTNVGGKGTQLSGG